jgi:tRNA-modifying protein YgfZ
VVADTPVLSGYDALRDNAAALDLSARGVLRVTGEDRARLLHAMSTNDIQGLKPGAGVYAFFLTAQGRIVADAYIYNPGDYLLLDTEPELAGKLAEHLDRYIIADDAELHNDTGNWAIFGLEGPRAYDHAAALGIAVPSEPYAVTSWSGSAIVAKTSATGLPGLRIFLPAEQGPGFLSKLAGQQVFEATAEAMRAVRLENGFPRYGEDITDRYLVQETGLLHAVHFQKGCYLGQEIVERVRSRAQVHRHLRPVRIAGTEAPPPGTKLVGNEKELGEITSATYSPRGEDIAALAYIRTEALDGKTALAVAGSEPPAPAYLSESPSNRP